MTTEGTPTDPAAASSALPPTVRPLFRSRNDRVLGGVAGGLGQWLDVDPVIFRVTFGVLTLFGGLGLVAYLIGYLLIPDEASGEALVSPRVLPDLRRLSQQQRALLGWGAAGVLVLIAVAGHRSTTVAVLIIVAAVAAVTVRARDPRSHAPGPQFFGQQFFGQQPFTQQPGNAVPPPGATFTGPAEPMSTWRPEPVWYATAPPRQSGPPPVYAVRPKGRRLNRALLSATVLAIGSYLLLGRAGAYDPTTLQATAVGLTALGAGLAATAWYAKSRGALVVGLMMTVFLLAGSAVQGDYGTSIGDRTWRPTASTVIPATYRLAVGDARLDLTQLGPAARGKTIKVSMGAGTLVIVVPDGLPISVYAHVQLGSYRVFGSEYSNDPVRQTVFTPGWTQATGIRIEAQLRAGDVEVDHG